MSLLYPPYPTVPGAGGLGAATLAQQLAPYTTAADPLLGGSLGIGRTGLSGLGALPPTNVAPLQAFARGAGLAGQVPTGIGAEALGAANALGGTAGGGGSLGARMAAGLVANPGASGAARFLAPGVTGRAALGRAGLGGFAGQIGSSLIDSTDIGGQNSNLEQGLQGVAQGAGLGAGIGSVVPGLGTGLGAVVGGLTGGAIGVLGNMFGGGGGNPADEREAAEDVLATAIQQGGIDDAMAAEIIDTYDVLLTLASAEEDEGIRKQLEADALQQAGQMVLQAVGQREQATAAASNTLALQAQSQNIFQPLADDIRNSAAAYGTAMEGLRGQLPPEFQAIADTTTAREIASSDKLANAYMAQAAVTPAVAQLAQYQQDFNSYAAQQFAQSIAQQAAGAGGAGQAVDISALLQA